MSSFIYTGNDATKVQPIKKTSWRRKEYQKARPAPSYSRVLSESLVEAGIILPQVQTKTSAQSKKDFVDDIADKLPWDD